MIYLPTVKQYCREYWLIENYDQAVADTTQTWHCHHRNEISLNMNSRQLKENELYFNVHYSELIFLTPEEHKRLHMEGENNHRYGKEGYWKGKEGPNKGQHHTEESKAKMSNAKKGQPKSEEWKHRMTKYHIYAEELYDLYVVQGLSTNKIAALYGCTPMTICYKLKKYKISK